MNTRQRLILTLGLALFFVCLIPLLIPEPGQRAWEQKYDLGPSTWVSATDKEVWSLYGLVLVFLIMPIAFELAKRGGPGDRSARIPESDPEQSSGVNGVSLHQAVQDSDVETARKLLASGADPNSLINIGAPSPNFDVTPLMTASELSQAEIAELLLDAGANIDAQDIGGWTALMKATAYGHVRVVELLLQHGADVTIRNNAGGCAADWAIGEEMERLFVKVVQRS